MTRTTRRSGLVVLTLILLISWAGLAAGRGDADEETTTTITDSAASTGATTVSVETLVVGGSTPEEYEAALPDLEAAVEADQEDLAALQELAIAQFQTGRYEEAAATYEKMLDIKDDAFTRNNYGNVLRDWGKIDEAKAQYEKAIATDPALTTAYINLAAVLVREQKIDEAVAVLDRGLAVITGDDKTRLETYKEQLTSATATTTS